MKSKRRALWLLLCVALCGLLVAAQDRVRDVGPINTFVSEPRKGTFDYIPDVGDDGSTVVALAFSGGGMRAAAFAYGVLLGLDELVIDMDPYRRTMADNVRVVAGVSAGAVTAGHFALKGTSGFRDLDRRFLYQDPESVLNTRPHPLNLMRMLKGGMNDRTTFRNWLDRHVFEGATFASLRDRQHAPVLWINASDLYHRTPFLFNEETFAALCSDLGALKLADAVAASSSFPLVFAPIVLEAPATDCQQEFPAWMRRALGDPNTSLRLNAYARALAGYRLNPNLRYVKLLDGALTDNLGITGLSLARASANTPHGPLSAEDAVKLRHLIFVVADAGRAQTATWAETMDGPYIDDLMFALIETNLTSGLRESLDALTAAMQRWKEKLVQYRCSLPLETVRRIRGTGNDWDCRDVNVIVEHLAFVDLGEEVEARLSRIPTRLSLPREDVDLLIEAGRRAVFAHDSILDAVRKTRRQAGILEPLEVPVWSMGH